MAINATAFLKRRQLLKGQRSSMKEQYSELKDEASQHQRQGFDRERENARQQTEREAKRGNPLADLQYRSQLCQEQYLNALRRSGILDEGQSKKAQGQEMSELHKAYTAMMVLQAIHPLQRGLNLRSVSTALSMTTTMALLSPNFRNLTKGYAGQIKEMAQGLKEGATLKARDHAQSKLDELQEKYGTADPEGLDSRVAKQARKWTRRVERMESMQRGHREPFNEYSAALTQVGLAEAAYHQMRQPGADASRILSQHQSAMAALYEHIEVDGVDRAAVSQNMRVIVGQRLEADPKLASVFNELAHARLQKQTQPQEVFLQGTATRVKVWNGGFYDRHTDGIVTSGSFSLREPMDDAEHRSQMARTMYSQMSAAVTPSQLDQIVQGYMAGTAANKDPRTVDLVEDPSIRESMKMTRTMFNSMEDDGFEEKDRIMIYGTALLDAMRTLEQLKPELAREWNHQFGSTWSEAVKTKIDDYQDLGERASRRPSRNDAAESVAKESDLEEQILDEGELEKDQPQESILSEREVDAGIHGIAGFEDSYAEFLKLHLHQAYERGGVESLDETIESLRVANERSDGSVTANALHQSFTALEDHGIDPQMRRSIYADGLTRAMVELADESPEITAHLRQQHGVEWSHHQNVRAQSPSAFVSPSADPSQLGEDLPRALTNAISQSISGDLTAAEAEVRPEFRSGAVHLTLSEYLNEDDSRIEDRQWHVRQSRIERMRGALASSGLDASGQKEVFATAFTHALEQVARRSPAAAKAITHRFGADRNRWQDAAFTAALGDPATGVQEQAYERRRQALKLSGSEKSYSVAEIQLQQDKTEVLSRMRYEAERNRTSRKTQRQRENFHHNGHEVVSGRWEGAEPDPSEPELGR